MQGSICFMNVLNYLFSSSKQGWQTHGGYSGCLLPHTHRWLSHFGWKGRSSSRLRYMWRYFLKLKLIFLSPTFQDYESHIRSLLPENNFSIMVSVLKKFFNFMNLTASVSYLYHFKRAKVLSLLITPSRSLPNYHIWSRF